MARKGLRKPKPNHSLRPRASRPGASPAVSGPVRVDRARTSGAPRSGSPASGAAAAAAPAQAIPPDAPIPRELRPSHPERLSDAFFASEPRYSEPWHDEHEVEDHDAYALPVMPIASRRAMLASLAIFGVFLVLILGYRAYHSWIMPEPVELGGSAPVLPAPVLPTPVLPRTAEPRTMEPAPQAETQVVVATPTYDDLVAAGEGLARGGRVADALAAYDHALLLRPDGSAALAHLAHLHLVQGDNARAKDYAARALLADPTSSEAWIVLGAAQAALGDAAAAQAAYRKCAALGVGGYAQECRNLAR